MKLVSITIQGMHKIQRKTYQLHNLNYLTGPNGAGKSTVIQAIQLALLGYLPGTDKNKASIFQHSNGSIMSVELLISNHEEHLSINRTWVKSEKDIVATVTTVPENLDVAGLLGSITLPVFNFQEFTSMTANKLKDWFVNFLPDTENTLDWTQILTNATCSFGDILDTEFINESVQYVNSLKSTGVQQVRDFHTWLKEQLSFKKGEFSRVQNTIQSLIYYEDCDTSLDEDSLKEELHTYALLKNNLNRKLLLIEQNDKIQSELQMTNELAAFDAMGTDPVYQKNLRKIEETDALIQELSKTVKSMENEKSECVSGLNEKQKIIDGNGICPYSHENCNIVSDRLDTIQSDIINLHTRLTEIEKQIYETRTKLYALQTEKASYTEQNQNIQMAYQKRNAYQNQINVDVLELNSEDVQKQLNEITQKTAEIDQLLIKIEANKKYNSLMQNLTSEKYKIEQTLEIIKAWSKITDVNGLQSKLMKAPFTVLSDTMTSYLRKFLKNNTICAVFNLTEKANSFSFGITHTQDSRYIAFDHLSSGEKCLYTLSLLLSIIETSDTQLPVLMIDDFLDHLDSIRIQDCFETLYSIDTVQIILAGVQNCHHEKASEFTMQIH